MTAQETYDNFLREFNREFFKLGKKAPRLEIKDVAMDMSEAQQELQRDLWIVEKSYPISLTPDNNTYVLPSDFGKQKGVVINGTPLLEQTSRKIYESNSQSGDVGWYAIKVLGSTQSLLIYPTPTSNDTAYLYYYPDFGFYSPSGISAQSWATFDGDSFTGNLMLPGRYSRAISLYILSKWFDSFVLKYEAEKARLRSARQVSLPDSLDYNLGWDNQRIFSGADVVTTIQKEYSKRYKFSMVEGEQPVAVSNDGFGADSITISETGGVITIASSLNEFVRPSTFVKLEPSDMGYNILTDGSEITITTYSGFSFLSGEIQRW